MPELKLNITHPSTSHSATKPLIVLVHGGALSNRMYRHGLSVDLGPFSFDSATRLLGEALDRIKNERPRSILIVGLSLGGQAVLNLIENHPSLVDAALVSGASIHPPDDKAQWEMPHMPTVQTWIDTMTEDVGIIGMDNAQNVQKRELCFFIFSTESTAPTLVMVGEHDVSMAKRDFEELAALAKQGNERSESRVLESAWHNHSIDVPEQFAAVIEEWARKVL